MATIQYCEISNCEAPGPFKMLAAPGSDRRKNRYFYLCEGCQEAYMIGYWRAHYEAHRAPHARKAV